MMITPSTSVIMIIVMKTRREGLYQSILLHIRDCDKTQHLLYAKRLHNDYLIHGNVNEEDKISDSIIIYRSIYSSIVVYHC